MTVDQEIEIRNIEAGDNPTRFARGWHCIGLAKNFRDGKPHQVRAFNTELVVFADSLGEIHGVGCLLPPHGRQSGAWRDQGRHHRLPLP